MQIYHLVVFTRGYRTAFRNRTEYHTMWCALRRKFPVVLACVLMPDHIHLLVEAESFALAKRRLNAVTRNFARKFHHAPIWSEIEPRSDVTTSFHLLRAVRYIHLNPPRKHLASDPLNWEWSTHLDAVGAVAAPWIDLAAIERAVRIVFPKSKRPWREELHAYVSGDPSVNVNSTPYPALKESVVTSLAELARAVRVASRALDLRRTQRPSARRVFIHLAYLLGDPSYCALAKYLGLNQRTIGRLAARPLSRAEALQIQSARLVVSDSRIGTVPSEPATNEREYP
jgi:REP element-mobilizing transposase RayT